MWAWVSEDKFERVLSPLGFDIWYSPINFIFQKNIPLLILFFRKMFLLVLSWKNEI